MELEKFRKYFTFPLELDEDGDIVYSREGRAFDFARKKQYENAYENNKHEQKLIIYVINIKRNFNYKFNLEYGNNSIIYLIDKDGNKREFIIIRSWGRLTGTLKLPEKEAKEIQDEFANFIIKQLK
jgi:hypothetical protein